MDYNLILNKKYSMIIYEEKDKQGSHSDAISTTKCECYCPNSTTQEEKEVFKERHLPRLTELSKSIFKLLKF